MPATMTDRKAAFERWITLNALELLLVNLAQQVAPDVLPDDFDEGDISSAASGDLFTDLFPAEDDLGIGQWKLAEQREAMARSDMLVARLALALAERREGLVEIAEQFLRTANAELSGGDDA